MKHSTIQYYRDRHGNVYREKKRYCTGIKDIDAKILSYLADDLLVIILQTNHYINSLAVETWKLKILNRYQNVPLPISINYQHFYYETKTYSSLFYHSIANGYNLILDWLKLPENIISHYVEIGYFSIYSAIESFLKLGFTPDQKSVNYAAECGNFHLIDLLGQYQIYPNIDYILRKEYKNLVSKLLAQNKRPSQKAIDEAHKQKEHSIIYLLEMYNIYST